MKTNDPYEQSRHHFVSRHMNIPPTPRDTMAVLMQEAERRHGQKDARAWWRPALRLAAGLAAAAILTAGYLLLSGHTGPESGPATAATADTETALDLAFDLAEWDMQVEAAFDQLDQTMAAIAYEQTASADNWISY